VASFAAQVAAMHKADLILQQVICPQEGAEVLAGRTIGQAEAELLSLVPTEFKANVNVRTMWCLVTQLRNCSTKAENSEPTLW